MKRLIALSLTVLLILICISSNVYAVAPDCTVSLSGSSECEKGKTFTVDVNISNVKTEQEKGITGMQGVLDYKKEDLTLVKIEGQNNWR